MAQVLGSQSLVFSGVSADQRRGGKGGWARTLTVAVLLTASGGRSNREEPVTQPHQAAVGTLPPPALRLRRPGGRPDKMVIVRAWTPSQLWGLSALSSL